MLAKHLIAYQIKFNGMVNVTFVGDLKPAAPAGYSVTLKDGTEDAENWKGKVGTDGEFTSLPVTKLEGSETVTITYNGTKRIQSVKAVKKADAPAYTLLSAATTDDIGKVVCAAGHLHTVKTTAPDGCTAVGILGKVTETGHGLILALKDATAQNWNTINGWTSGSMYDTYVRCCPTMPPAALT